MFNLVKVKLKFSKLLTIITPTTTVHVWALRQEKHQKGLVS